jgi:hypothetical protein
MKSMPHGRRPPVLFLTKPAHWKAFGAPNEQTLSGAFAKEGHGRLRVLE